MLISPKAISGIWGISPNGVIHVGAHQAEESAQYASMGWGHVYWFEANPELVAELMANLETDSNTIYECAAWDVNKVSMTFHETTDTQSSSLLGLKKHSIHYPKIKTKKKYQVETRRIDSLFEVPPPFTFANIDVQGAELQALKGMGQLLTSISAIYSEVNREELYENCAKIEEIDAYLKSFNFKRVGTRWILKKGWGDALYLNRSKVKFSLYSEIGNIAHAFPFYARQILSLLLARVGAVDYIKRQLGKTNRI